MDDLFLVLRILLVILLAVVLGWAVARVLAAVRWLRQQYASLLAFVRDPRVVKAAAITGVSAAALVLVVRSLMLSSPARDAAEAPAQRAESPRPAEPSPPARSPSAESPRSAEPSPPDRIPSAESPRSPSVLPLPPANTATTRVFFGTDREPLVPSQAVFADEPGPSPGRLRLGWCTVSVPRLRHKIGEIERPTFWTLDVTDWFENPDRHFVILDRPLVTPERFWATVRGVVGRGSRKQLLLFVHGYNVSFDNAVYRTAQLAFDLKFAGAPVLYSWPSHGTTLRYAADLDHSMSTIGAFKTFLVDLTRQSGARTIHIIAHSMGNNALVHALAELVLEQRAQAPRFRQIIMAAPDVDRREFLRLADAFQSAAERVTLYAAANDRALGASEALRGYARVGDASPMFLRKGIESIDASAIIRGFLKHSYFADERVLGDIERLIEGNTSLPRFGLIGMPSEDSAQYWRFR